MTTYDYRCTRMPSHADAASDDRSFEAQYPMGSAPARRPCPTCGSDAVRVFGVPMISKGHAGARRLLDRAERSRTQPDVVGALPPDGSAQVRSPGTRATINPAWATLPRP